MTDKKDTREPRFANIVEVSRMGEKVVGKINKRTGEITMFNDPPKPAKSKNVDSERSDR